MRKGLRGTFTFLLAGAAPLFAQTPIPTSGLNQPTPAIGPMPNFVALDQAPPMVDSPFQDSCANVASGPRLWGSVDYLYWWVRGAPFTLPLVTTGNPSDVVPGAIGQPGTAPLFGGSPEHFGGFSGSRVTFGGWIDRENLFGIEASGFVLEQRTKSFFASGDAKGNPPIYVPFTSTDPLFQPPPSNVTISDPKVGQTGTAAVTSDLQLWGAEANSVICVWRRPGLQIDGIVGFRYLDLREDLALAVYTQLLNGTIANSYHDSFNTRNQFYGGQFGAHGSWQAGRIFAELTTKIGLGSTHEVVDIQGTSAQTGPNAFVPPGLHSGGIFAQPSNIGRFADNHFSVVPTVDFKVGYQITSGWRAYVGYDYLYWTQVVRPGNQVDPNINISQTTVLSNGRPGLIGPAQPSVLMSRSDFWAQGITCGLEFRY